MFSSGVCFPDDQVRTTLEFPMSRQAELTQRDLAVLWHPCTQMKDHEHYPLTPIERGEGVWLFDFDGNRYIDAISSWWTNVFGHANPVINQALAEQAGKLEHVIFAGFSHEPGIRLAERLVEITPPNMDRVFYGDNGSSAVEILRSGVLRMFRPVYSDTVLPEPVGPVTRIMPCG